jgi:hypothetical protein
MTVEQWLESTHREGDQSLIGVSPDALAKLLEDSARLDWMLSLDWDQRAEYDNRAAIDDAMQREQLTNN